MRITKEFLLIISLFFITTYSFSQKPKNIILMIGDGMGFNHIEACNNYYNEKQVYQAWDSYRVSTYSKEGFYNSDSAFSDFNFVKRKFTDSGAAATALGTGFKTHNGVIGLNENYYRVQNLTEFAEQKNMNTGVVTSVPFCHATPAGFVAHIKRRNSYHEIASQMLIESKLDVIIGCGNPLFDENGNLREVQKFKYIPQQTFNDITSNKTLLTDFEGNKKTVRSSDSDSIPDAWTFISSSSDFKTISKGKNIPKRLFGMPEVYSTLQANRDFEKMNQSVSDLSILSLAALNVVNQNDKGFFLMIEGGAIDWASHDSSFIRAIEETHDFNRAIESVVKWVEKNSNWDETLLIITADHETGYLTGISSDINSVTKKNSVIPPANSKHNTNSIKFNQTGYGTSKCDHTNQLVPLFVKGKGSELFIRMQKDYLVSDLNFDKLSGKTYIDNTDIARIIFRLMKSE